MSFCDAFHYMCGKAELARNEIFKFSQAHADAVMGIWQMPANSAPGRRSELCSKFFEEHGPYTVYRFGEDTLQWRSVDGTLVLEMDRAINKEPILPSTPGLKMYFAGRDADENELYVGFTKNVALVECYDRTGIRSTVNIFHMEEIATMSPYREDKLARYILATLVMIHFDTTVDNAIAIPQRKPFSK